MLRAAGHLGLWPGLYAVGALLCLTQLAWFTPDPGRLAAAAFSVLFTATGAYILDRVKLRDAWIDPADITAQPERYAFLVPRARFVRLAAVALLGAGALAGLFISRYAPLSAGLAALGVVAYALKPRRRQPRPKDIVWIKNLYVALGITSFAALAALAAAASRDDFRAWLDLAHEHVRALVAACSLVAARVLLDAALCDIDDEPADRAHRTHTFSTRWGPERAWSLTGLARIALIAITLAATPCPWRARLAWAIAMSVGTLALRLRRPERVRDPVDLRLFLEAAAVTAALAAIP